MLGSTDVPTVQAFMKVFAEKNYTPKMFIAASGPDQGAAFTSAVGTGNAAGMMVPNGWYPGFNNAASKAMVSEYVKQYHVSASGVNADVAEAYSVGQVAAAAITATGGTDNTKIIQYLHSGVTLQSVQGPVQFNSLGENVAAAAFVFQWQDNGTKFVQVLPQGTPAPTRSSPPSRPGPPPPPADPYLPVRSLTMFLWPQQATGTLRLSTGPHSPDISLFTALR